MFYVEVDEQVLELGGLGWYPSSAPQQLCGLGELWKLSEHLYLIYKMSIIIQIHHLSSVIPQSKEL